MAFARRLRRFRMVGFSFALVLLAGVALATVWTFQRNANETDWVAYTYRVIAKLHEFRAASEHSGRTVLAFHINRDAAARVDFEDAGPNMVREARELRQLVSDNPRQLQRASRLVELAAERREIQARFVEQLDSASSARREARENIRQMDALVAEMLQAEEQLLGQRQAMSTKLARWLAAFSAGSIGLAIAMLILLLDGLSRENRRNRQLEVASRKSATQLEASMRDLETISEQQSALGRYASLLQASQDAGEALRITGHVIADLVPGCSGNCYLLRESADACESAIAFGDMASISDEVFLPELCWAMRRAKPFRADSLRTGMHCEHVHPERLVDDAWCICLPLIAQGKVLGVLQVNGPLMGSAQQRRVEDLLSGVAEQLGLALVNLQLRERLRVQSLRDPLTGLHNRRYLDESLVREVNRAMRRSLPLAVMMVDVDHFKQFNDAHGHAAGDAMLAAIAKELAEHARQEDLVCRYGGEEFTLVLAEMPLSHAVARAEELRLAVAGVRTRHGDRMLGPCTASFGLAMMPEHGTDAPTLLQSADAALYMAKRQGRNQVVVAEA